MMICADKCASKVSKEKMKKYYMAAVIASHTNIQKKTWSIHKSPFLSSFNLTEGFTIDTAYRVHPTMKL